MLSEVFYWVFNMGISASIVGIIVEIIRGIKRIPRRFSIILWLIPFFRMTVPFGLGSPYSLMSLLSRLTTKTVTVLQPFDTVSFSMTNFVMEANTYFPITYKINTVENIFRIASVVWIIGASSIIMTLLILYLITLKEIKRSRPYRENIYFSEKVLSPAVYGILRPKIILPTSYAGKDIELICLDCAYLLALPLFGEPAIFVSQLFPHPL